MAIVRYVLAKLRPGVDAAEYERFEREVDYVVAGRLKTIVSYRTWTTLSCAARPRTSVTLAGKRAANPAGQRRPRIDGPSTIPAIISPITGA